MSTKNWQKARKKEMKLSGHFKSISAPAIQVRCMEKTVGTNDKRNLWTCRVRTWKSWLESSRRVLKPNIFRYTATFALKLKTTKSSLSACCNSVFNQSRVWSQLHRERSVPFELKRTLRRSVLRLSLQKKAGSLRVRCGNDVTLSVIDGLHKFR